MVQRNKPSDLARFWKKIWHFIWEEDSILSWLANIAIAFVLIKFVVYPGLGLIFGTSHPVVAVMSASMEHERGFDYWWREDAAICAERIGCSQEDFYRGYNVTEDKFNNFRFKDGFNTGDIMIIMGTRPEKIKIGDVVVYWANEPIPIIHRVIEIIDDKGANYFKTKGDNNPTINYNEARIRSDLIVGKAVLRIPYLGWVKIGFVRMTDTISNCLDEHGFEVYKCFA